MLVRLDETVCRILCCPQCKGDLATTESRFGCISCGMIYPQRVVGKGENREHVFDFCIRAPAHCESVGMKKWSNIQKEYERGSARGRRKDRLDKYLEEIDSVKEIYTEHFSIKGSVLDVGGHQGRLRHFLSSSEVPMYVSVDPYVQAFEDVASQTNLLKAYPCLTQPCNFLACDAENLPFKSEAFDWVHMRSVHDHIYDPYLMMIEAYRVLKSDGMVLIGLAVTGGQSTLEVDRKEVPTHASPIVRKTLRLLKSLGMIKAAKYELKLYSAKPLDDGHMCRWEYDNLVDLLKTTNFEITKEHWQKPPYSACVYIAGRKQTLDL